MESVNIKGKEYVLVNERIKYFREHLEGFSLETEIIELYEKYCVLKAIIKDINGRVLATGLAREVNGDTFINKTSYVENCETSAWGRALGNLGIGIDTSIASAEEVANAINNQDKIVDELVSDKEAKIIYAALIKRLGDADKVADYLIKKYEIDNTSKLMKSQYAEIAREFNNK